LIAPSMFAHITVSRAHTRKAFRRPEWNKVMASTRNE
jgi:hypothetical protein